MAKQPPPPPAPKGNQLARKHGGHSQIAPTELEDVAVAITQALPVQHVADEWAVAELADALMRVQRFRAYLDANDPWTARSKGHLAKIRSAIRHEQTYANRVMKILKELGMTPAARAKLGVDLARTVSLTQAMAEPDPAKRAALLERAGIDTDAGA